MEEWPYRANKGFILMGSQVLSKLWVFQTRPSWRMGQLELMAVVLSFCRKFRVELQRAMNREAQRRTIVSRVTLCVGASSFVTLLAGGHIVLHYVTIIILHNAENALEFRGNGP